ncbi:hypothetical protein Q3O97_05600 [Ralstonia pseudosolanacearum]|uniref:hypothetical protein n=1 Tax=Ralstonia pseudosolanacearum TaxID=1310165 RepID=UPI00270EFFD6|nr:hypothetical protein [Ralstonia pseudosolanacearum]MDO3615312.1 hypothetical protein [Ralstonia pseudosolanacearum]
MADIEDGRRVFLARVRERLAESGHELLDTEWLGWNAPYRFRCAHGHEASRTGNHANRFLIACPTCRAAERLARLQQVARQAGGECLSDTYIGRAAMYRFRCGLGHEFEARASKVIGGSWCKHCVRLKHSQAIRDPNGLARLQETARRRGGECLAQAYARLADTYRFRCADGHEWSTSGQEVVRGAWCALCANKARSEAYLRKDGLAELHRLAQSHGGQCLADRYDGANARYRFRCEQGHEWQTNGARIFRGAWCPTCAYEDRRLGIEAMQELAAQRGGLCISHTYVNNSTKLEWECARGHRWHAAAGTIRAGHWCAQCHFLSLITLRRTRRKRRYEVVDV